MVIHLVSASAGSGKTYHITRVLCEGIAAGRIDPAGVLATTFTVKAAEELRGRLRRGLVERGRFAQARELDRALIGTIHSICQRLILRHAFAAGHSPALALLPAREQTGFDPVSLVMGAALKGSDVARLSALAQRLSIDGFRKDVAALVEQLRTHRLDDQDSIARCCRASCESLSALPALGNARFAFEPVIEAIEALEGATTKTAREQLPALLDDLREGCWSALVRIEHDIDFGKKARVLGEEAARRAQGWEESAALKRDLLDYVEACFAAASATLREYREWKAGQRRADFSDLELRAVELLSDPAVLNEVRRSLSALVVDEFQDCSPVQLELFDRLMPAFALCVGDPKQAIYGFRGSDPELMRRKFDELRALAQTEVLGSNWRSRPELVAFTSGMFASTFAGQDVAQQAARTTTADLPRHPVRVWRIVGKPTRDNQFAAIATGVEKLLASAAVRPGDIAILTANNDRCSLLASQLRSRGIPCAAAVPGLFDTFEGRVLLAALIVATHPDTPLEEAELDYLLGDDTPDAFLDGLLAAAAPASPLAARLRALNPLATPTELLDALIFTVDLPRHCRERGFAAVRLANLEQARQAATQYESLQQALHRPATAAGLARWFLERQEKTEDLLAPSAHDAVAVLTVHKAKGLEWPVVITAMLDSLKEDGLDGPGVHVEDGLVRFWPHPFGKLKKSPLASPLGQAIESSAAGRRVRDKLDREAQRLMYVALTRARDLLVLPAPAEQAALSSWDLCFPAHPLPRTPGLVADFAGTGTDVLVQELHAEEARARPADPESMPACPPAAARSRAPRTLGFSAWERAQTFAIGARRPLGTPIAAARIPEQDLGVALHHFLVADDRSLPQARRIALAERIFRQLLLPVAVAPQDMLAISDRLAAALPGTWKREWPLALLHDGQRLRGRADLLVETPSGWHVVDHKTGERALEKWQRHAVQLEGYALALAAASGRPVVGRWLHLPLRGELVEVIPSPP